MRATAAALLLAAGCVRAEPAGAASHCLGEWVEDAASGECVLAANAGDEDEPMASHSKCAPSEFLCPDRVTCAEDARAYAACATGFSPEAPLLSLAAERAAAPCHVPSGTWECGLPVPCTLNASATGFTVAPESKAAWAEGRAVFGPNSTVTVEYAGLPANQPAGRHGTIGPGCSSIAWNDSSVWTCATCPAVPDGPVPLDVHIIAHTHDDTGYLSTVDEYYESNVRSILTTVTEELQKNQQRKFTYVEIAFFAKWWDEQNNATKATFRRLVAEGQLDFTNGGWCMPDEGAPSYQDMIANMQKGLRYIQQEFGDDARPRVAWSIDPFGHSSSYAILNALFEFDMFVVGRIDFQEKAARFATKTLETVWRPSRSANGASRDIMTAVLDPLQFYSYPPGFNFEGDQKSWITDQNVEQRAQDFAAFIKKKAAGYATNSLLVPFGSDFQYTKASINYENMDKLMAHMNANIEKYGMRLQYSTPTYYMKTLHAKNLEWEVKVDDFESYAIGPDQFLVGFYSSRPDFKGFVRMASTQLRAANVALTNAVLLGESTAGAIDIAQETSALDVQTKALGVSQHHDAITSSQRRHVHRDYIKSLSIGQAAVDKSISRVVAATISTSNGTRLSEAAPTLVTCPYLNESTCAASTAADGVTVVVFQNPTAQPMVAVPVKVPIGTGKATVTDSHHRVVASQSLPTWPASAFVHNETLHEPAPTVAFQVTVPALGTASYFIEQSKLSPVSPAAAQPWVVSPTPASAAAPLVLDNGIVKAQFSATTGLLESMTRAGVSVKVTQNLKYYHASDGSKGPNNPYASQGAGGSGNYIFQPDGPTTYEFGKPVVTHVSGPVVSEVRHVFVEKSIEQVFRLYNGSDTLEVEYRVGPIDISDGKGKEVISHFATDIASGDVWSTDVNGMQIDQRKRNSRATLYPGGPEYFNQTDPVAGNYFAANTQAYISDQTAQQLETGRSATSRRRFTVLIDRSEGATSMASGNLELMVHRRLAKGCRWGMCEPNADEGGKMESAGLNDTLGAEVVVKHWLSVDAEEPTGSGASHAVTRARARQLNYPPSLLFGHATSGKAWPHVTSTAPLQGALPENLELTTWQVVEDSSSGGMSVLLRLTHIYDKGEHPVLSKPATVDICEVFGATLCSKLVQANVARASVGSSSFVEMTTAGDVPRGSVERLRWQVKGEPEPPLPLPPMVPPVGASMPITIEAADTRTFMLTTV
jgi:lysosomal alpha-mannosidase